MDKNWCKECVFYVPHYKFEEDNLVRANCGECGIEQDMLTDVCKDYKLKKHKDIDLLKDVNLAISFAKCEKRLNQANKSMKLLIKKIEELKN